MMQLDSGSVKTLNDWVCRWLQDVLPNVVKASTVQMYTETMERHILSSLGEKELEDITAQTVEEWVFQLRHRPVAGTENGYMTEGTVRNTFSVLSGCMRDAQRYGLVRENPCAKFTWTNRQKSAGKDLPWLREEELKILEPKIADYRDEEGYPAGVGFQMILYAGVTLSEAVALRWENVDLKRQEIRVEYFASLKRKEGGNARKYELEHLSGKKRRAVPIPDLLADRLGEIQREYSGAKESFVLCGSEEKPLQLERLRAVLGRRSESLGLGKVTPRMLRDTYAMRAVRAGATSDMIAELMGFASPQQVLRRYMPENVLDKKELVERMFSGKGL